METAASSTYRKGRHIIEQSLPHIVQYHFLCNLQKESDAKARLHFQNRKINLRGAKLLQIRRITTIYIDEDPHNLCLFSQSICDPIQQKVLSWDIDTRPVQFCWRVCIRLLHREYHTSRTILRNINVLFSCSMLRVRFVASSFLCSQIMEIIAMPL